MSIRARLLDTPADRVSPELARTVSEFCEPIDVVHAAFIGLTEVTEDFHHPKEHLSVAFELAEPLAGTEEGDRELRLVADRFYDTMPEEIIEGGCNFLEPGGIAVWREKAHQVFSR
ncbi:MAG TPA: hypothetical protein VGM80_17575 [Gaiellaceae bacterium]